MRLGSGVAVAVVWAGSCGSEWSPSLGTFICLRCSSKKKKKMKFRDRLVWKSVFQREMNYLNILIIID